MPFDKHISGFACRSVGISDIGIKTFTIYVMCFILPRDIRGISILRKMRKNEKI